MAPAYLDEPWRRLGWIIPVALLLWAILLTAFALLIERTSPPIPALAPAEVRIVELPPTAGLQGGPAPPASSPAKSRSAHPKPRAHVRIHRPAITPARTHHLSKPKALPKLPPAAAGAAKPSAAAPTRSESANETAAKTAHGGIRGGTGSGLGAGIGSDSGGARAIFAPTPVIPDDLREQSFQTVAVAHFKVSHDGQIQVTLTTPTQSPRLNQILLETLKKWRFFPAMRHGVAIDSQFDVRIPISVQ